MGDRQLAGALGREHLDAVDLESEPIEVLEQSGVAVEVETVVPVLSKKAGEDNTAYLVVEAELDKGSDVQTVLLCHCWDFVVRQFPAPSDLPGADLGTIDDCKHIEQAKRFQGDAGVRADQNQGLGDFLGE